MAEEMALSRRDFIRLSAYALSVTSALPAVTGCSTMSTKSSDKGVEIPMAGEVALTNCNIVDVKKGNIIPNGSVLIKNGQIDSIVAYKQISAPNGIVFDLKNNYIIPGLIDAHTHLTLAGVVAFDTSLGTTILKQVDTNFFNHIRSGVTTVRDMGALVKILHEKIDKVQKGELVGPRVIFCNKFTNLKGGHPSISPLDLGVVPYITSFMTGNASIDFEDTKDLEEKIVENMGNGASFIKLTMDDDSVFCGKKKIPIYSPDHLSYISTIAYRNELPMAAHTQFRFGFNRTLKYPISSIEHLPVDGELTEEELLAYEKNKIPIIPTCVLGNLLAYPEWSRFISNEIKQDDFVQKELEIRQSYLSGPAREYINGELLEFNHRFAELYKNNSASDLFLDGIYVANPSIYYNYLYYGIRNLSLLKQAGAMIGCGTDAGVGYNFHGTLWYEMEMMNRVGFEPVEILRCATLNNAQICRMENKLGSIDKGKIADIVVLDRNPLQPGNIETFRSPLVTYKEGQMLYKRGDFTQNGNTFTIV